MLPSRVHRPQESEEKRKQAQNKTLATVGKLFAGSQPPKEEVNQDAEVFPTWSGHKKVVTTDISAPSAEDGLRRITVSSRVVQKDMWQEESRALERRALEGDTPRSAKVMTASGL